MRFVGRHAAGLGAGVPLAARAVARQLERRHLQWLLAVGGLGLLLAVVALRVKLKFGFGRACLFGLGAITWYPIA